MTTEKLIIKKKIKIPMFGTWNLDKNDYASPLIFPLAGANAFIYLSPIGDSKDERGIIWEAILEIHISPVSANIEKGLTTSGKLSTELANKIYNYYLEVIQKTESLLLYTANIKNLFLESPMTLEQFYNSDSFNGKKITWFKHSKKP